MESAILHIMMQQELEKLAREEGHHTLKEWQFINRLQNKRKEQETYPREQVAASRFGTGLSALSGGTPSAGKPSHTLRNVALGGAGLAAAGAGLYGLHRALKARKERRAAEEAGQAPQEQAKAANFEENPLAQAVAAHMTQQPPENIAMLSSLAAQKMEKDLRRDIENPGFMEEIESDPLAQENRSLRRQAENMRLKLEMAEIQKKLKKMTAEQTVDAQESQMAAAQQQQQQQMAEQQAAQQQAEAQQQQAAMAQQQGMQPNPAAAAVGQTMPQAGAGPEASMGEASPQGVGPAEAAQM